MKLDVTQVRGRWRALLAWTALAAGAISLVAGWFAVSGQTLAAKQLPYLISGGLGGLGFIAAGVGLLIAEDLRQERTRSGRLEAEILEVRDLLESVLGEQQTRAS